MSNKYTLDIAATLSSTEKGIKNKTLEDLISKETNSNTTDQCMFYFILSRQ